MNTLVLSVAKTILIGLGATLTFDLWGLLLKYSLRVPPSNLCLVGRWLCLMPEGIFRHECIGSAPRKSAECVVGWLSHYAIGVTFASIFVALAGTAWLQQPTPAAPVAFGLVTVFAPFFIMQPALGLGYAASKASNPAQARLRSMLNHAAFGIGLYLFALLVN